MHNQTMGVQREGGFAEYITMPIERIYDGKGLPAKTLALIEPFCISWHGVSRADVKAGERVLVVGAGTIGVLAAVAAKANCFGARVVLIGVSKKNIDDFFFTIIQKKELNIYGSRNAMKKDFLELIDLVKAGGVDLEKIVTNTYKMADAPQAFADFSANAGKMLKVVIDFA